MKQLFLLLLIFVTLSCSKNSVLPSPIVSLSNQNFVYRGIDNKLEIDVPRAKSFKVTAPGLRQSDKPWEYIWYVTETNTATLDFEIVTKNDSLFHDKKEFYIQDAKLVGTLNDHGCTKCIIELLKQEIEDLKIGVRLQNSSVWFHVRQFTLVLPEGYEYKVYENRLSNTAKKMILQYPNGTIFKIKDIEYNIDSYSPQKVELKFILVDEY